MKIIDSIWIEEEFLKGVSLSYLSSPLTSDLSESHDIWEVANETIESTLDAEKLLTKTESDKRLNQEKLNQGFSPLRRVFEEASNTLKISIGIDEIKYKSKSKQDFISKLDRFQIIRKKSIRNLIKIRNCIEHRGGDAPDKKTCILFSDYMWFYIGRVAAILDRITQEITVDSNDENKGRIEFRYKIHKVRIDRKEESKAPEFRYEPELHVFGVVNKKYIHYIQEYRCMKVEKIELLNTKNAEIEDIIRGIDIRNQEFVLFKGEIVDQDIIAEYVTQMIIPELGGINDEDLRRIFIQP